MFAQDWPLALSNRDSISRYPFPEREMDPVMTFMDSYQPTLPGPVTEQPIFITDSVEASARAEAKAQEASILPEPIPTWAWLAGGAGLLLLL